MKVLLAIPSYNRPYEIEKTTSFWLKQLVGIDWKVFVREEQFIYYLQNIPIENLVAIKATSFRETINELGEYARKNNYDLIHKIDDDMSFKKLGKSKKEHCAEIYTETYEKIIQKFQEDEDLYGISVSKPMAHMRTKDLVWARPNKSMYGNFCVRPQVLFMPEGIELFDDVFFSLNILKQGKKTLTYTGAYENSVCYTNVGGLQSVNRNELSKKTIKVMQSFFPDVKEGHYKDNTDKVDIDLKSLNIK